jgi:hypothetical protein
MKPPSSISRGRSRAKLIMDAEEANRSDLGRFIDGMLSAIGERLAERHGDLYAAEVFCRASMEMDLKVPAHEVMAICGKGRIP